MHMNIGHEVARGVVHSATSHTVGALMRGHSFEGVLVIAVVLIAGVALLQKERTAQLFRSLIGRVNGSTTFRR